LNSSTSRIWTRNYLYFCGGNFLIGLIYYLLATTLPLYVQTHLGGNESQMGLMISVYVLGSVLCRVFSGYLVDHFGKKRMAILGFALFFIACVLYLGVKGGLVLFLAVRFVHGISYSIASTAINTAVISILPRNRQGEGIGYFGMFINLAMVMGPSLGLFLWKSDNIFMILIPCVVLSAVALFFMWKIQLPEAKVQDGDKQARSFSWKDVIELRALPISFVAFCMFFSYSSIAGFLAAYTQELNLAEIASIFFMIYGLMIVGFRPFIAKLFDRFSPHTFFYPAIIIFGLGMGLLSIAVNSWMVLGAGVIMGLSYGVLNPLLQNTIIQQVPYSRVGAATATFFLMSDLGYGAGSYVLGVIASHSNFRIMFISSTVIAFVSLAVYMIFFHRKDGVQKSLVVSGK